MEPAINKPYRCQRCGHRRDEHGTQYPRPCERLDYTFRCRCAGFVQRMSTVENVPPLPKAKPQTRCAFCVEPIEPGEPTCGSAMCLQQAVAVMASLLKGE